MSNRRKKKRSSAVPWIVAIALLAALLAILLVNIVFVVRQVQVVGAGEVPESTVRHLSGIRLGSRMSSIDEERVRLDVESDGQVAFVSLERRLPGRIVLTVRPRTRDAVVLQAGKILVLDSDGYVVEVGDRVPDTSAVYVTGLKASYHSLGRQLDTADGRCGCMKAVLEALKANGATAYAAELSVADTADIRIITRTGMTVLLGNSENMDNKIVWMVGALRDLESRGETTGRLDVSSGTKADYMPPAAEPEPEEEPEATPVPAGEISSIDGVIYIDGVPVEGTATDSTDEAPAS